MIDRVREDEDELEDAPAGVAQRPRIGVVGNLNVDLIMRNVAVLPRWGEEVEAGPHMTSSAGQAGYLAMALARLDAEVIVIGVVGDDDDGYRLREDLTSAGVSTANLRVSSTAPTGITVAIVRPDGERSFISDFGASREVDAPFLARQVDSLAGCDLVCLVGLFNLPNLRLEDARTFLGRLRRAGIETMLDTGWDPHGWSEATVASTRALLSEVSIFIPNLDESRALLGISATPESAVTDLQRLGPHTVIVKCGVEGSCGRDRGGLESVVAVPVTAHDAVGAGDTFNAGYLRARAMGADLREAMSFAAAAAAHYVSHASARFPSVGQATELLTAHRASSTPHKDES